MFISSYVFVTQYIHIFVIFLFHAKVTADSQPQSHHSANNVDKNGTMTNYPPSNQGNTSDNHTPITRNTSFGSRHDSPPVSPHAKPRIVIINCFTVAIHILLEFNMCIFRLYDKCIFSYTFVIIASNLIFQIL